MPNEPTSYFVRCGHRRNSNSVATIKSVTRRKTPTEATAVTPVKVSGYHASEGYFLVNMQLRVEYQTSSGSYRCCDYVCRVCCACVLWNVESPRPQNPSASLLLLPHLAPVLSHVRCPHYSDGGYWFSTWDSFSHCYCW